MKSKGLGFPDNFMAIFGFYRNESASTEDHNNTDTWYRCTVCGREGTVGRCCGDETRIPLNEKARKEQAALKRNMEARVYIVLSVEYTCQGMVQKLYYNRYFLSYSEAMDYYFENSGIREDPDNSDYSDQGLLNKMGIEIVELTCPEKVEGN